MYLRLKCSLYHHGLPFLLARKRYANNNDTYEKRDFWSFSEVSHLRSLSRSLLLMFFSEVCRIMKPLYLACLSILWDEIKATYTLFWGLCLHFSSSLLYNLPLRTMHESSFLFKIQFVWSRGDGGTTFLSLPAPSLIYSQSTSRFTIWNVHNCWLKS